MIQYTKNHVLIDCQQNKKAPTFVFCIPKIASSSVLEQSTHGPNSMYRLRIPIENAFAMHRRNDPFAIIAIDRGHKYANAVLPNRHQDGPCMFAENGQTLIIEWSPSPEGPQGAINSHSFPTIKAWARVEVCHYVEWWETEAVGTGATMDNGRGKCCIYRVEGTPKLHRVFGRSKPKLHRVFGE